MSTPVIFARAALPLSLAIVTGLLLSQLRPSDASPADSAKQALFNHEECEEACNLDEEAKRDMQAGNYLAAIDKLKLAVVLHPNLYSAENNLAIAYENLAISQRKMNELAEAEASYIESYRRMQQNYKKDGNELVAVCDGLAETEELLGKFKDAQSFRAKSICLSEKIHGKNAQCVIKRKLAYAQCLRKLGENGKAEQIESEVKANTRIGSSSRP